MSLPTILLVDDDSEDVSFFKRALSKAGLSWNLRVAEDGQKAVDQLSIAPAELPPSHVLLDLKLPKKSGLEVLAWIRSHPTLNPLPVIVLTSSDVPADIQKAQALGIDAYLVKPLTTSALVDTVRQIARRWNFPVVASR
jgi:CheY-like chemotaxis protein